MASSCRTSLSSAVQSMSLWITLSLATLLASAAEAAPRRILSMNMCLDPVLIELVPREHIVALSQYSRDPWRSTIASVAKELPYTNETAEEIVALEPELVVASVHSAIATRNALRRAGVQFELFEVPASVAESLNEIRRLARLLEREEEGEALIARIEAAIARARPAPGIRPVTAAIYQPGGLTAGRDTVTDELMRIAGLHNVASDLGIVDYRPLPLELLIRARPEILLVGHTTPGAATHAERVVHHRALRSLQSRMQREPFPARLLYCAGPTMIDALDALVRAREHALNTGNGASSP